MRLIRVGNMRDGEALIMGALIQCDSQAEVQALGSLLYERVRIASADAKPPQQSPPPATPQPGVGLPGVEGGSYAPAGDRHREGTALATEKQVRAIIKASKTRGFDLEAELRQNGLGRVEELSLREASLLLDKLNGKKPGRS